MESYTSTCTNIYERLETRYSKLNKPGERCLFNIWNLCQTSFWQDEILLRSECLWYSFPGLKKTNPKSVFKLYIKTKFSNCFHNENCSAKNDLIQFLQALEWDYWWGVPHLLISCLFVWKEILMSWLIITGTQIEEKGKESENTKNEIQNLSIS